MKKLKLTDWYKGSQKPCREGVYERDYGFGSSLYFYYCYWNGQYWSSSSLDIQDAFENPFVKYKPSDHQHLPWRGVLK